jgi:hypothetical protein
MHLLETLNKRVKLFTLPFLKIVPNEFNDVRYLSFCKLFIIEQFQREISEVLKCLRYHLLAFSIFDEFTYLLLHLVLYVIDLLVIHFQ